MALGARGAYVPSGARLGCCAGGETTLAHDVAPALRPGMLHLTERQAGPRGAKPKMSSSALRPRTPQPITRIDLTIRIEKRTVLRLALFPKRTRKHEG